MFTFSITRPRQTYVPPNNRRQATNMAANVQQATDAEPDPIGPTGAQQATEANRGATIQADIQPANDQVQYPVVDDEIELIASFDQPPNNADPNVEPPIEAQDGFGDEDQESLRRKLIAEFGALNVRPEYVQRLGDVLAQRDGNQQPDQATVDPAQAPNQNAAPADANARPVSSSSFLIRFSKKFRHFLHNFAVRKDSFGGKKLHFHLQFSNFS